MAQLAKPSDLATRLGVAASDPGLLLALQRASDRFEGEVGYPILKVEDDVVHLSGDGTRTLLLPAVPVVGEVTVVIGGSPVTDFEVARRAGILRRDARWPDGLENIEVTYTHGWDSVPGDIADAVLEQAEATYWVLPSVANVAAGSEQMAFFATAASGVTQRWSDAVARYELRHGDRS